MMTSVEAGRCNDLRKWRGSGVGVQADEVQTGAGVKSRGQCVCCGTGLTAHQGRGSNPTTALM